MMSQVWAPGITGAEYMAPLRAMALQSPEASLQSLASLVS